MLNHQTGPQFATCLHKHFRLDILDHLSGALRDGHEPFPLPCRGGGGSVRPHGHETIVGFLNHGQRQVLDMLIL